MRPGASGSGREETRAIVLPDSSRPRGIEFGVLDSNGAHNGRRRADTTFTVEAETPKAEPTPATANTASGVEHQGRAKNTKTSRFATDAFP